MFPIELVELNQTTYDRVRLWFDQLDLYRKTILTRQLDVYPICDELIQQSGKYFFFFASFFEDYSLADGPNWSWIMLNILPIEIDLQYQALMSRSYRTRLQIINEAMDFFLQQQQQSS